MAALVILGTLGTFWQIRVMSSALPFLIISGAWAAAALHAHLERQGATMIALKVAALCVPFSVQTWLAIAETLPDRNAQTNEQKAEKAASCFAPSAFAALRDLPRQLTLATIDLGPYVLAHSQQPVVAAAYHRNNRGNHLLIEAMIADPEKGRALIENAGVKLLVYCPTGYEFQGYVKEAPQGLAAVLRDTTPSWLTPIGDANGAVKVMAVR